MFGQARDPLREYLQARRATLLPAPGAVPPTAWRVVNWCLGHWEFLHHVWTYGLALAISLMVFNPAYGWVNLAIVPVQVLFLGSVIALMEWPTLLLLIVLWNVAAAAVRGICRGYSIIVNRRQF